MGLKPRLGAARINWSHPITQGLVGCWLLDEGVGTVTRNLAGVTGAGTLSASSLWTTGLGGYGARFVETVPNYINCGTEISVTSPITVAARVTGTAPFTTTTQKTIAAKGYNGTSTQWYLVCPPFISSWNWAFGAFVSGVTHQVVSTSTVPADGVHNVAGVYDGTAYRIYANGVLDNSATDATAPIGTARNVYIGAVDADGTPSQGWGGDIYYVYHWARALTSGQVQQLHIDPYVFLMVPIRRTYFVPASAPAGSSLLRRIMTEGLVVGG